MPADCSLVAREMSSSNWFMRVAAPTISCIVAPACCTTRTPLSVCSTLVLIKVLISRAAAAVR
jgi:hypothetical protein